MTTKRFLFLFIHPLLKIYWRIIKPKTFGVKALITHPLHPEQVLLVRHSYGNTRRWNIPGGGYRPSRERAEDAVKREVNEELAVELFHIKLLGEFASSAEGKRDTVTMFCGSISDPTLMHLDGEIAEVAWVPHQEATRRDNVSKVALRAIALNFAPHRDE